jgi:hypothetical protein
MKNITFLSFIALLAMAPSLAHAGSSQGLITAILAGQQEPQVFFSAGVHQNKPACSTQGDHWAISIATPGGKATQAVLLTAYALKKPIHVEGKGVCDVWSDRETVNYLYTVD